MRQRNEFIQLVQENKGLIYKVAKMYTDSPEDEEDLYQDIVYQLWKSFQSFRNDAKISTWLYRIALNTAIAHLNKRKKRGRQVPIDEGLLNKTDPAGNMAEEQYDILYAHIKRLSTVERAIILLYLDGSSYDEIAGITGFSPSNVGTRLGRIKQKLILQIN